MVANTLYIFFLKLKKLKCRIRNIKQKLESIPKDTEFKHEFKIFLERGDTALVKTVVKFSRTLLY